MHFRKFAIISLLSLAFSLMFVEIIIARNEAESARTEASMAKNEIEASREWARTVEQEAQEFAEKAVRTARERGTDIGYHGYGQNNQ